MMKMKNISAMDVRIIESVMQAKMERPEAERFEAVDLARLKITINDDKTRRQIKTFPLKS